MTFNDFMTIVRAVLEILGLIGLAGAAFGGLLYKALQRYAQKWLDARFEERLAAYKHEQQKELEQLRFKISALLDRTVKLHQREFEVTPEAWSKLNDAFWKTMSLVSPFKEYPDLARMTDEHFLEFVETCQLGNWEKNELKKLLIGDRNKYYRDHVYWPRLNDTRNIVREANVYLMRNGIFLRPDIKNKFTRLTEMVWGALLEDEFHQQNPDIRPETRDKRDLLRNQGEELLKKLESKVHTRLWGDSEMGDGQE